MKRYIPWLAILGALMFVAPAGAQPSGSETITTTLVFPYDQLPNTAPFVGSFSGTFSASGTVSDSGSVSAQTVIGAAPSPVEGVQTTLRTYSGSEGTLTLRCVDRFSPPGQPITAPVSLAGSCAVLNATGAYAGLKGSGTTTGTTTFGTSAITVQDTLTLGEH